MRKSICLVLNLLSVPFWAIGFIWAFAVDAVDTGKCWFDEFEEWVEK